MKRIVFTVTNDLCYDQRMERIRSALAENGYDVCLIGRADKNSNALDKRSYEQQRIICSFEKGKLFYIEYNFKLLWKLLFTKTDIICSIDLDSILPGYLASLLRGKTIVYDAHEYFTEMEEVVDDKPENIDKKSKKYLSFEDQMAKMDIINCIQERIIHQKNYINELKQKIFKPNFDKLIEQNLWKQNKDNTFSKHPRYPIISSKNDRTANIIPYDDIKSQV